MSTINEVCNFFGVTRQTVHAWQKRGVIRKPPRRGYDLQEIAQAIVADWIALKGSRGGYSSEASLSAARAELAREQTIAMQLKNAVARGEYVRLSLLQRSAETIFTAFRERVLSMPGKIAAMCEMRPRGEVEKIVRSECYEALEELSRPIIPVDGGTAAGGCDTMDSAGDDAEKAI
jgi:phage terminase Nu1 subunit (DNA packaging protein)